MFSGWGCRAANPGGGGDRALTRGEGCLYTLECRLPMKIVTECYECLRRLARQAAELSTSDERLRAKALERGLAVVEDNFSYDEVSITIATKIHRAVREVTGNTDPYRGMKDEEIRLSRELMREVGSSYGDGFGGLLGLSVLGNAIDFFRDFASIREDMGRGLQFSQDDSATFVNRLEGAEGVLFLADNAGEVFFDLPLVKYMSGLTPVTYVVKESAVQNDLSLEDLERSGLAGEFGAVMTTGAATPGVVFSLASEEFRQAFDSAELILAKGMAYYEALTELPPDGRILHCLKAKCRPVADSLGVPLDSYVAVLR